MDEEGFIIMLYKKKNKIKKKEKKRLPPTQENMTKLLNKLDVVHKLVQIVAQREGNQLMNKFKQQCLRKVRNNITTLKTRL